MAQGRNPAALEAIFRQAVGEYQMGNLAAAAETCRRLIGLDGKCTPAYQMVGAIAFQMGNHREAAKQFSTVVRLSPDSVEAYINLGLAQRTLGQLSEALTSFRKAVRLAPQLPEAHNHLGSCLMAAGQAVDAAASFQQALRLRPGHPEVSVNLGQALLGLGKAGEAETFFRAALAADGRYLPARNGLGVALVEQGRLAEASECLELACAADPRNWAALTNLGGVRLKQGRLDEAVRCHEAALALFPDYPEALTNLALVLAAQGRHGDAAGLFQRALELKPAFPAALAGLGTTLATLGRQEDAVGVLGRALEVDPDCVDALVQLGRIRAMQNRPDEALALHERAVALRPSDPAPLISLGGLLQDKQPERAEDCFRQALALRPDDYQAVNCLVGICQGQGRLAEATACYDQFLASHPDHRAARLGRAILFPVIAESVEQIQAVRAAMPAALDLEGWKADPLFDPQRDVGRTNFYLAYHEQDDRQLQALTAAAFLNACPSLGWSCFPQPSGQPRIRVGILSRYLHQHTIGKLTVGLVEQFDRQRFEIIIIRSGGPADRMAARIDAAADRMVPVPETLEVAREIVAGLGLDVLFYPDIGMDPFTYYLAYSRLAPVQVISWGHPDTTGIPNIDYFLSAEAMEPPGAEAHYTERLIRLKTHLPTYYQRITPPDGPLNREAFGLPTDRRLYVCPQSLFKLHPAFDPILAEILLRDDRAQIVLIAGKYRQWETLLRDRFARSFDPERVTFLPFMKEPDFLRLLIAADVVLDSVHFSGGLSSFEAFSLGVPIVTWPGEFMRDRVTAALYSIIGVTDAIADSAEGYVQLAIRLANDPAYRASLAAKIERGMPTLLENPAPVREIEAFFAAAVEASRRGETLASW